MKKILLLILGVVFLISCSNELDRDEALEIITKTYDYPNVETVIFPNSLYNDDLNNKYMPVRKAGLINFRITHKFHGIYGTSLTAKGNLYKIDSKGNYKVASNILDIRDVSGIKFNEGKTEAEVIYNIERSKVTPFGQSEGYNNGDLIERKVRFNLYDDGWRINDKNSQPTIKPENVLGFNDEKIADLNGILAEITMESSRSNFLLKDKYVKYGKTFYVVDYVGEDGSNTNPKLRTFVMAEDFNKEDLCNGIYTDYFEGLSEENAEKTLRNQGAFMVVVDGEIKCIAINTAG